MRLPTNAHVAIVDGKNFIVMRNSGQPLEPKLGAAEKPDLSATNFSAGVAAVASKGVSGPRDPA